MPLSLTGGFTEEKNKLTSDVVLLTLLKIEYEGEDPGYLCLNNETVVWPTSGGNTYLPTIYSPPEILETNEAEIPAVPLTIIDIERNIIPHIDTYGGGVGATITMYEVASDALAVTDPANEYTFEVISVSVDASHRITFSLGAENLMNRRCPQNRYLKNFCRFVFKSTACGYSGSETECDRTLARCKELSNVERYGGFPGIGSMGVQA